MDCKEKDIERKQLGRKGEDIACALLREKGFGILERNFRASHKEIDIICRDGSDIRFVEVKSRRRPMEGEPWEAVDAAKQRRIGNAAKAYINSGNMRSLPFVPKEYHFDIVTVVWEEKGEDYITEYIPDAYILIYA